MNRDQIRALLAYAAATTRDWAPTGVDVDVWLDTLSDLDYDDCRHALVEHAKASHYRPTPADIRASVKRLRADRMERAPLSVPAAHPDDVPAYLADLRAGRIRQADGTEQRRDLTALLGTFRDVPAASPAAIGAACDTVRRIRPAPRADLTHAEAVADMDRMLAEQAHRDLAHDKPTAPTEETA